LFNQNFVSVTQYIIGTYEVTISILWSQFFYFKYLWNLQTTHHQSQNRHQKVTKGCGRAYWRHRWRNFKKPIL